ncbi:hypothetical protein [Janthinobacterium sp.]|uniref:hypothetical protein n=1 Tax=Janthinobacterium sp. TaxID=1871054 RepID=UPI0025B9F353|nr:hypothetical protein [Janthinobacterium sp.]
MRFVKQTPLALLALLLCACGGPNDPTQPPLPKVALAGGIDAGANVTPGDTGQEGKSASSSSENPARRRASRLNGPRRVGAS